MAAALAAVALGAVPVAAGPAAAHELHAAAAAPVQTAAITSPCPGRAITPDQVIQGEFDTSLQKSYVMVPFDVPTGTTAVRVKYCLDRP